MIQSAAMVLCTGAFIGIVRFVLAGDRSALMAAGILQLAATILYVIAAWRGRQR